MLTKNVDLNNKTILVTGAAGFIGSNLVNELLKTEEPAKIVGIDNVRVRYIDANNKNIEQSGRELPARISAFCEESVIYMYRMSDSNASRCRLEQHLGLEYSSKCILGDTNVVSCGSNSLPCVSLRELVEKL